MDINPILFLIAVLNLLGDLYNIVRFRHHIPGWVLPANIAALVACGLLRIFMPESSGVASIAVLLVYLGAIKFRVRAQNPNSISFPSHATKLLIACNVLAYAFQIYRDAVNIPFNMVAVGALYSPLLEVGEWWRLVSAQFLHWGVPHLALNMLGLWILGPKVEAIMGPVRFIVAYLISGAGGMLIAWGISRYGLNPHPIILLGASASVLGVVGLQAAFSLQAFRYSGSLAAKAQLSSMVQIIVLQAIFDWMVPQVSSTAHLGGAVTGFLIGMLLIRPLRRRVVR
jgi:membrane associated rhomboid family serine protease